VPHGISCSVRSVEFGIPCFVVTSNSVCVCVCVCVCVRGVFLQVGIFDSQLFEVAFSNPLLESECSVDCLRCWGYVEVKLKSLFSVCCLNSGLCGGITVISLYSPVVTICTTSLTFNNSTFCPHSVFMCFVRISEKTTNISLYNIN